MTEPPKPACFMPNTAPDDKVELYRRILAVHCPKRDEPGHECRGAVTIRRNHVTASCPLCGDARMKLP